MHRHHRMPFGAEVTKDGVRFALWAPSAKTVTLVCGDRNEPMPAIGQGWFKLLDAKAEAGARYGFAIDGADALVPDPASRFQADDRDRRSTVVDPESFIWSDGRWRGRPWNEVVLSEVHVGTATLDGTYAALEKRLSFFADAGITAIELMPLAATAGRRTWGYDGVLPYAPNNAYGTPDDLKRLVDAAHARGLMIFLDVVYNHFGPTGNFLHGYAADFFTDRHTTPWGAAVNFDSGTEASEVVREFFIQNALYWLEEFHVDGLRFDAVHAIVDTSETHFLEDLAARIRAHISDRHVHLVLENEANEARRLVRDGDGNAAAYDAQWDDDYHHCWHVLLTGEDDGYYRDFGADTVARLGRALAEGFAYQGERSPSLGRIRGERSKDLPPQAFVAFLQNHDQIGNRAQGERLAELADPEKLRLARAILYLAPLIPMVFMGDEWGARTRFQFFVDFPDEPELEDAIRKGRTKEFERFRSFGPNPAEAVPDPTAFETFARSRLDWSEIEREPYAAILAETRDLLAIRRRAILPISETGFVEAQYERIGAGGLAVSWRFEGGTIGVRLNFAAPALVRPRPARAEVVWTSPGLVADDASPLPPWSGLVYRSVAHE